MTPYKQLLRHDPANGVYGDCHRTAIACLLDIYPASIPHFLDKDNPNWEIDEKAWLKKLGFYSVSVPFAAELKAVLETLEAINPGVYAILGGTSKNGCGHSVVICGGNIIWDPSLDSSGIIGPMSDGFYWITYIITSILVKE